MSEFDAWFRPRLRTMQIISLALPLGALLVVVVLALLRNANPQPLPQRPILSILFLGFWFVQMSLSLVIPGIVTKGALKQLLINPLQNADLRGANFRGANLAHASFLGADLTAIQMLSGQEKRVDFSGAILHGTGFMAAGHETDSDRHDSQFEFRGAD